MAVKVLFLKDVEGTARAGDVKDVANGHARNYLLPRKLAIVANDRTIAEVREREEAGRRRAEKALQEARELATRIKRLTVTIYAKTGEGGKLFGSVTNTDIAQQLKREAGIDVDKRKITVDPPIKSLGPHEVEVEIHAELTETLRVVVAAQ